MSYDVEKDWITKSGFRAVVIKTDMGHRCGYVGVDSTNPFYGKGYDESLEIIPSQEETSLGRKSPILAITAYDFESDRVKTSLGVAIDVHGGLTYSSSKSDYPIQSNLHWFGFDCAHYNDLPDEEHQDTFYQLLCKDGAVHRTLDFCTKECESMASQLKELSDGNYH